MGPALATSENASYKRTGVDEFFYVFDYGTWYRKQLDWDYEATMTQRRGWIIIVSCHVYFVLGARLSAE